MNVNTVTEVRATYTLGLCSVLYTHFVSICGAPEITGDIDAPTKICLGETATVTVSNVTGGTTPYAYNYYTNSNYNELYTIGQTSKNFLFSATETVYVRVKDGLGNISNIGSVLVEVATAPVPNIIPSGDTGRILEDSENVYEIDNDVVVAVFKTEISYVTYGWEVIEGSGSYTGALTGIGATFSLTVADITGTISLKVTVISADGCTGTETVTITVVAADVILESDELLFVTSTTKLYKVAVSPSSIGTPSFLCGAGNPAISIAMRGNGQLISSAGSEIYVIDVLGGCGNSLIGTFTDSNVAMGMLNADVLVTLKNNALGTYDLLTDTQNTSYYTISDGVNTYFPQGDIVRIGNTLYALARQSISGVPGNKVLIAFTLNGSDVVTGFTNVGALPNQAGSPFGLATIGGVHYLVFADGKVYNLNLSTPATSTLIGTIIVPGAESIYDVTDNFA